MRTCRRIKVRTYLVGLPLKFVRHVINVNQITNLLELMDDTELRETAVKSVQTFKTISAILLKNNIQNPPLVTAKYVDSTRESGSWIIAIRTYLFEGIFVDLATAVLVCYMMIPTR